MLPGFTLQNTSNCSGGYPEQRSQVRSGNHILDVERSDGENIRSCEFMLHPQLPEWHLTLAVTVVNIITRGSKPQMGWINAQFVISIGTVVKNPTPAWHWSIVENPRCNVSAYVSATSSSPADTSIPGSEPSACPNPASIRFLDFRPEAKWEGFGKPLRTEITVSNVHCSRSARTALQGLPGYFFYTMNRQETPSP